MDPPSRGSIRRISISPRSLSRQAQGQPHKRHPPDPFHQPCCPTERLGGGRSTGLASRALQWDPGTRGATGKKRELDLAIQRPRFVASGGGQASERLCVCRRFRAEEGRRPLRTPSASVGDRDRGLGGQTTLRPKREARGESTSRAPGVPRPSCSDSLDPPRRLTLEGPTDGNADGSTGGRPRERRG